MEYIQTIKRKIKSIRRDVRSSLTSYKFQGYKHPWFRLLARPLRTIMGNFAWKRLTDEQRNKIHRAFFEEAIERGYDEVWAHGSAWAGEEHLRKENLVKKTILELEI